MISQAASRIRSAVSVATALTLAPHVGLKRLHVALGNHRVKGVDVALVGRVAAGRVAAGANALLRELADAPVLAVHLVPEVDGVGGVEAVRPDRLGLEVPLADDLGPVDRTRPQGVEHHVVGVERDERVREEREVVDGVVLGRVEPRDRRALGVPVAAHGLGALVERHGPAAPRARP